MKINLKDGSIDAKNFKIDSNGNATFSGDLDAAGGTFSGDLSAAGGTFSGTLKGVDGTFSGKLSAATGTFSGDLSAAGGTFSGTLKGVDGTFSGDISAATGSIGGWKIGTWTLTSYNTTRPLVLDSASGSIIFDEHCIMFGEDGTLYIDSVEGDIDLRPSGNVLINGEPISGGSGGTATFG